MRPINSKTDYTFNIAGRNCVLRSVPCYDHYGAISFSTEVIGVLPVIKDMMLLKEIPDDIEYEAAIKILRTH